MGRFYPYPSGNFTGTETIEFGAVIRLRRCQWSNAEGNGRKITWIHYDTENNKNDNNDNIHNNDDDDDDDE